MKKLLLLVLVLHCVVVTAQHNMQWCFGDSAGINFSNQLNPVNTHSIVKSRGSCVSVSDTNGNLQFYGYTRAGVNGNTTKLFNYNNQFIQNRTNIVGEGWYNELCIIPFSNNLNKFYLFSVGVTGSSQYGLFYSVIDMTLNTGNGGVIQKNIPLQQQEAGPYLRLKRDEFPKGSQKRAKRSF